MGQGHTSISAREHKQLSVETVQFCITAPNDQHVGRKKKQLKKRYKSTTSEYWDNSKLSIYFPGSWSYVSGFRSGI